MSKILGRGVPTEKTYGILGQEYIDTLTGERYICTKSATVTSDKVGEADHRCEWELEGSGGTGGGLSIKSITFTDRATMYTWLNDNSSKIVKAEFFKRDLSQPLSIGNVIKCNAGYYRMDKITSESIKSGDVYYTSIVVYEVRIYNSHLLYLVGGIQEQAFNGTFSKKAEELSDEYWKTWDLSFTFYYID